MSVATKNPFSLLDSEEPTPADSPAPEAPAVPAAPAPTRGTPKSRGGPAARGGKYYPRGGGASKSPRENGAEDSTGGGDRPKRTFDGEGRGEGRGRGRGGRGGRGDRGDRGGERRGRGGGRLDRHSATGKTDSDKKVHQSWGGDDGNTELKVEEAATVDAAAEGATNNEWGAGAPADDPWGAPVAPADDAWALPTTSGDEPATPAAAAEGDKNEGRRGREREQEEEDNTLTLDQYLAQKAEKEASLLPKLETRKANEGADDSLWKDAIPVQKSADEVAYFATKPKSAPKARAEKKEKVFLEIDARFDRPDRGGRGRGRGDRGDRGDRGARGGGRPRGGDGGSRRGRPNGTTVVNVDDEQAFPTLS